MGQRIEELNEFRLIVDFKTAEMGMCRESPIRRNDSSRKQLEY
jgi:hypothetical protein